MSDQVQDGRLPEEYGKEIVDDKGNIVKLAIINNKHLFIRSLEVSDDGSINLTSYVDGICLDVQDALRLIMQIANIVEFSKVLDDDTNEILRAIEITARHAVRVCVFQIP